MKVVTVNLDEGLAAALRDPECPVQFSPLLMAVKQTLRKQGAEAERMRAALELIAGASTDKLQAIQARAALDNIGASPTTKEPT